MRRLIGVCVAVLGVGVLATACSPVKMGAAAIVGNQRITVATLDTEVSNLNQNVKPYTNLVQLNQAKMTSDTLSWLIRFQIIEQFARQQGISVSQGDAQRALTAIVDQAKAQAAQQGVTHVTQNLILVANGIPPDLAQELGRYQAIEDVYAQRLNGGKIPTSQSAITATNTAFSHSQCLAARSLNIEVNPQFGRLDYTQYGINQTPDTVSRPQGTAPSASSSGSTPSC